MHYVPNLMNHVKAVQAAMDGLHGTAVLNVKDLVMIARLGSRSVYLQPQFIYSKAGRLRYTLQFERHVTGFAGWRPYFNKRWGLSTEKLQFKAYANSRGIRTPQHWLKQVGSLHDFVIKKSRSSFGVDIRGPFRCIDPQQPAQHLEEGEYYEAFIPGRIAKAWYWDGKLCALELRPPPLLTGDGKSTVPQLAEARCAHRIDGSALAWVTAYQGRSPDAVLREGEHMPADFKYGSPYDTPSRDNENVLAAHRGSDLEAQFEAAGRMLMQGIPESIRPHVLYTLDAVVDDAEQVWLLEMNSNPMVHPDVYTAMLQTLLAPSASAEAFPMSAQA